MSWKVWGGVVAASGVVGAVVVLSWAARVRGPNAVLSSVPELFGQWLLTTFALALLTEIVSDTTIAMRTWWADRAPEGCAGETPEPTSQTATAEPQRSRAGMTRVQRT